MVATHTSSSGSEALLESERGASSKVALWSQHGAVLSARLGRRSSLRTNGISVVDKSRAQDSDCTACPREYENSFWRVLLRHAIGYLRLGCPFESADQIPYPDRGCSAAFLAVSIVHGRCQSPPASLPPGVVTSHDPRSDEMLGVWVSTVSKKRARGVVWEAARYSA